MSVFSKLFNKESQTKERPNKKQVVSPIFQNAATTYKSSSLESIDAVENMYSYVYACADAMATEISRLNIRLYQGKKNDKNRKEILSHPALDLLEKPNPYQSKNEFLYSMSMYLSLVGESFYLIARYPNGLPGRLDFLYPPNVLMRIQKDENILYQYTSVDGYQYFEFPQTEILQIKHFNPTNRYRGYGKAQAVGLTVQNIIYAQMFRKNFFQNGAILSGYLSIEEDISPLERKQIKQDFKNKNQGIDNAFDVPLLTGGMKFEPLQPPLKDLDMTESRQIDKEEILRIFRTPEVILGSTDANRASANASEYVYMKHGVDPEAEFIVDWLTKFYLPIFGQNNKDLHFDYDNIIPGDQLLNLSIAEGSSDIATVNERRALLGWEKIKDGDKIVPSKLPSQKPTEDKKKVLTTKDNNYQADNLDQSINNALKPIEDLLEVAIIAFFLSQKKTIIDKLSLLDKIDTTIRYLDLNVENLRLLPTLKNSYLNSTKEGINLYNQYIKDNYGIDDKQSLNANQQAQSGDRASIDTNLINETTIKDLTELLSQSIAEKDSIKTITEKVSQMFDNYSNARASLIAKNGTHNSASQAFYTSLLDDDNFSKKQWATMEDTQVRSWHMDADGQIVPKNNSFVVMGEQLDYPGDLKGSPENIIGCRCWVIPIP